MKRIKNRTLCKFAFYSVSVVLRSILTFAICIALSTSCTELEEELTPENTPNVSGLHGSITITSNPKGAEIWIDDKETGALTDTILEEVAVGSHVISLYLDGLPAAMDTCRIVLTDSANIYLHIDFLHKWEFYIEGGISSWPAFMSDGSIIFTTDHDYDDGQHVYVLTPSGNLKWHYEASGTSLWMESSPTVARDGSVYFGSNSDYLYALSSSGKLKWRYMTGGYVRTSPAIAMDGTIYFGSTDHYIYAVNPDGELIWRFETGAYVESSPAISEDGVIYIGSNDNYLYALNPDGSLRWKYLTVGGVDAPPAIGSDGTIYVGSYDDYLYAISPSGDLKWRFKTGMWIRSSVAIDQHNYIYILSTDGYLYSLTESGSLRWKTKIRSSNQYLDSSPIIASDGTIYVSGYDCLLAIAPTGDIKWSYKLRRIGGAEYIALGSNNSLYAEGGWIIQALNDYSGGLANSPWPKFQHDNQNTGCASTPIGN